MTIGRMGTVDWAVDALIDRAAEVGRWQSDLSRLTVDVSSRDTQDFLLRQAAYWGGHPGQGH